MTERKIPIINQGLKFWINEWLLGCPCGYQVIREWLLCLCDFNDNATIIIKIHAKNVHAKIKLNQKSTFRPSTFLYLPM